MSTTLSTQDAPDPSAAPGPPTREALEARRAELRADLTTATAPAEALAALAAIDQEIRAFDTALHGAQLENLVKVHEAMGRLRGCESTAALIEATPRELCDTCGFTRAMISRVEGSVWVPQALEVQEGVDPEEDAFRSYIQTVRIPLDHMLLETDLVRRRIAALVTDPYNDPRTHREIVDVARSTSYVAAPIMLTRRVIGFLHADRYGSSEPVTPDDRDLLWAFAEHFGLLFERAVLVERLVEQRSRLSSALSHAAACVDELYSDELELTRRGQPATARGGQRRPPGSRVAVLLTAREREVLELLATGATNAAVAQELVISEGTIKSHVKRIHRKLHVSNRAEAVAKFLHLVALDEGRGP